MYMSNTDCKHTYQDADAPSRVLYKVDGKTLDKIVSLRLRPQDKIGFIKVDIDGSEAVLFEGGEKTLKEHKPLLFIEYSPFLILKAGRNPKKYFQMLNSEFFIFWYTGNGLKQVSNKDFNRINEIVKNGITDFLLSYSPLLS